jgi:hypothetical protein
MIHDFKRKTGGDQLKGGMKKMIGGMNVVEYNIYMYAHIYMNICIEE